MTNVNNHRACVIDTYLVFLNITFSLTFWDSHASGITAMGIAATNIIMPPAAMS